MWKPPASIRVIVAVLGFIAAIFLPWWVAAFAVVFLSIFWRAGEALFIGLLLDFAWATPGSPPLFTLGAIALVWILEPVRKEFFV